MLFPPFFPLHTFSAVHTEYFHKCILLFFFPHCVCILYVGVKINSQTSQYLCSLWIIQQMFYAMVFALRAPGQGERRVQCLEWTHLLRLGTAHLTEGRMPAALQRGRPFPLARTTKLQWILANQYLGARKGREMQPNHTLVLSILFISTVVGWPQKKMNS